MILKKSFLFLIVLVFMACEGGDSLTQTEATTVTVSGTITYDSVPFKSATSGALDYDNIVKKKVRGAVVSIEDSAGKTLGTTSTDSNGFYSLEVTGTSVRVRVFAQMYKPVNSGQASWDFQVKDNTHGAKPIYAINGSYAALGDNGTQERNLNASSGWGGSSYSSTRAAAPFSILDVVYQSVQKVLTADANIVFPSLDVFWSKDNRNGTIGTSHYLPSEVALYILGKENADTDEYDTGVLAHEWGHYYEDKFSRADSIGGHHGNGDMLDIRIAFGEGFATALGGLIIDSPFYQDSGGIEQSTTFVAVNLEEGGSTINPGWFSEASIYHIIYDIYDSRNDRGDTLSLSFSSLHNLLIGAQKNTAAFTSIFTYIAGLKAQNPTRTLEIDAITRNEGIITPISDIYGTGRSNRFINANPLYANLLVGGSVTISPNYSATSTAANNRLGTHNFVMFTISTERTYSIRATGTSSMNLDFFAFKEGSKDIAITASNTGRTASGQAYLTVGNYRMFVTDSNRLSGRSFNVTLN